MGTSSGAVSVVIPAYNEEGSIAACIEALQAGTRVPGAIIVADGGSTDATVEVAERLGATVVPNPGRTAAAGRNVGTRLAETDIVAFVDADCVPVPGWLEAIERRFATTPVDGVAGKVMPRVPRNACEAYWNHLAWEVIMRFGDESAAIAERDLAHSVITASCAWRRSTLERLHGFDEWFGNNAEDIDLTWRALDAGCSLMYDPAVAVYADGALTPREVRQKAFRNGVSSSKLQKRYGGFVSYDPSIYRMLIANLRHTTGCDTPGLERQELVWHLLGKYAGSLRHGVINV